MKPVVSLLNDGSGMYFLATIVELLGIDIPWLPTIADIPDAYKWLRDLPAHMEAYEARIEESGWVEGEDRPPPKSLGDIVYNLTHPNWSFGDPFGNWYGQASPPAGTSAAEAEAAAAAEAALYEQTIYPDDPVPGDPDFIGPLPSGSLFDAVFGDDDEPSSPPTDETETPSSGSQQLPGGQWSQGQGR